MCIRDRNIFEKAGVNTSVVEGLVTEAMEKQLGISGHSWFCLLYTSDAADERSSVDLGGRRIIKKKTKAASTGTMLLTTKKRDIKMITHTNKITTT